MVGKHYKPSLGDAASFEGLQEESPWVSRDQVTVSSIVSSSCFCSFSNSCRSYISFSCSSFSCSSSAIALISCPLLQTRSKVPLAAPPGNNLVRKERQLYILKKTLPSRVLANSECLPSSNPPAPSRVSPYLPVILQHHLTFQ